MSKRFLLASLVSYFLISAPFASAIEARGSLKDAVEVEETTSTCKRCPYGQKSIALAKQLIPYVGLYIAYQLRQRFVEPDTIVAQQKANSEYWNKIYDLVLTVCFLDSIKATLTALKEAVV